MGNPWRGEVGVVIDGVRRDMRLTLGALAGLEAELGAGSLVALVERFETGAFGARDVMLLIAAGLGESPESVAKADFEGGPMAAARAAARLLALTFALPPDVPG